MDVNYRGVLNGTAVFAPIMYVPFPLSPLSSNTHATLRIGQRKKTQAVSSTRALSKESRRRPEMQYTMSPNRL
jgi:hypothetical protein